MNTNILVNSIGTFLFEFFEYCEEHNVGKAQVLNNLYAEWSGQEQSKKTRTLSNSDYSDDDTSVASLEVVKKKKKTPAKKDINKDKDKDKERSVKPRNEQSQLPEDLSKKKLRELKDLLKERGLPVSGNKALLIENLLKYENEHKEPQPQQEHVDHDDDHDHHDDDDDHHITIKRPQTKDRLNQPATKQKHFIERRYGHNILQCQYMDGFFVLDDDKTVIGWIKNDDIIDVDIDDYVDIHQLTQEQCKAARDNNLTYNVPHNLDVE